MARPNILTSIHGRLFGIGPRGRAITNVPQSNASYGLTLVKRITTAQVLALFATPIEVIEAPGAGLTIGVKRWRVYKPAGTAYAGIAAAEDLVLRYTDASGAIVAGTIETTGFLDQATAQVSRGGDVASVLQVANAAVMLHLTTAEITTGDSDLYVEVEYDIEPIAYTK